MRPTRAPDLPGGRASRAAAILIALGVFLIDVLTPLEGAVAVLYVAVVLIAARAFTRRGVILTSGGCLALTIAAYLISHDPEEIGSSLLRCLVSLAAIGITTALALRHKADAAVLAEQARLLDLTHDAVFVRDARGVITVWNRAAEVFYGWPAAEAAGCAAHDLLHTEFPEDRDAILTELNRTGRWEGELIQRTRAGRRIVVESRWALQRGAAGEPLAVLETNTDITERKEAEAALLTLQADLAHAARVATMGELTATMAHEINQPLAAVVTNGEAALRWLRRPVPDLGEAAEALTRAVANGRRAGEIVARIRAFLAKAPPRQEWLDLTEMIGEAAQLLDRELARHDVTLRAEREPGLPLVRGDRVQLQQVMINLMVNGIQAMAAVADRPRILTVRTRREEGMQVRIEVADTGEGIRPEAMERLFQPFFTTKSNGMGMGLAICRSTVEAHGGRLWVSEAAPGAVFRFTLPAGGERAA
ncbi:sensor histidine kinase [Methylobacterium sp. ID0610]|uniref:sensor histidine kinase n=1 Tax=Methylobacterium carpenticola TaxID=3344827 RepID=UPI0036A4B780